MLVTVFLGVLVLALLIGNAFLAITKPSANNMKPEKPSNPDFDMPFEMEQNYPLKSPPGRNYVNPELHSDIPEVKALAQKVLMAHRRLDNLENLVYQSKNNDFAGEGTIIKTSKKLDSLLDFKNNTKIEIEALKERVATIEKRNNIKPRQKTFEEPEDSEDSEDAENSGSENSDEMEKIHNLIYRGSRN